MTATECRTGRTGPATPASRIDLPRAEAAIRELLLAVGEDPDREGLLETPARVARAYGEIFRGLAQEPADVLTTTFELGHDELVLVRDIEVYSTCEHHLLPFHGVAHVGYIPGAHGRVTGLSKLARLVDVYARRPQLQERLTTQVADALEAQPGAARRPGRRRVRAPVHVDARGAQARLADHHLRGPRPAARPGDEGRGDEPGPRTGPVRVAPARTVRPTSEPGIRRPARVDPSRVPRWIGRATYLVGLPTSPPR